MRLAILGSGFTGNVALVEATAEGATGAGVPTTRLLIDAGLSRRLIEERLAALSPPVALEDIDAVLITHEHSDHVGCVDKLGRPIYAPGATLRKKGISGTRVLAGQVFRIGALSITPVLLPHDAEETVGYVFSNGIHRLGILTDCGEPEDPVARAYAGLDLLVLEANHDRKLLAFGPYPPSLQRRVRGPRGHLSNEQSATLLAKILALGAPPQLVIAAHRSLKNNRPELVESALRPLIPEAGRLVLAEPTGAAEVRLPLLGATRQLGFAFSFHASSAETPSP